MRTVQIAFSKLPFEVKKAHLQRKFDCRLTRQQFAKKIYQNSHHKPLVCIHSPNMNHIIYMHVLGITEAVANIGICFYLTKDIVEIPTKFSEATFLQNEYRLTFNNSQDSFSQRIFILKYVYQHEIIYKICFDNGSKRLIHFY